MSRLIASLGCIAALLVGCDRGAQSAREIVVVVDADAALVHELRSVRVQTLTATGSDVLTTRNVALDPASNALPFSFALVPDADRRTSEAFRVLVSGLDPKGALLVERQALVSFSGAGMRRLDLYLSTRCAGVFCRAGGTDDGAPDGASCSPQTSSCEPLRAHALPTLERGNELTASRAATKRERDLEPRECEAGFEADAIGRCVDVDECSRNGSLCDPLTRCTNVDGSFTCSSCPNGYADLDEGAATQCAWDEASLAFMGVSAGHLVPTFDPATTSYDLTLPVAVPTLSVEPALPKASIGHVMVSVDGVPVDNGSASQELDIPIGNRSIEVNVVAESGRARTYRITAHRSFDAQVYVKASNPDSGDGFGASVGVSGHGDLLVVGAYGESSAATGVGGAQSNNELTSAGAAYVYRRAATSWAQEAYLKASNAGLYDLFGWSVAMSSDGSTIAVGAPQESSASTVIGAGEEDDSADLAGAVYVFRRKAGAWTQVAYLKASDAHGGAQLGFAVSVASDGHVIAAGAPGPDGPDDSCATGDDVASAPGAVYVFTDRDGTWVEKARLAANNAQAGDRLGFSLALAEDGMSLVAGAPCEDGKQRSVSATGLGDGAENSGAAYVFTFGSGTWKQSAYLKASNADAGDWFGQCVTTSRDGSTVAVAAPYEASPVTTSFDPSRNGAPGTGAVYVYDRGTTSWSQTMLLKAPNGVEDDLFGSSVAISADGRVLAVGADQENGMGPGLMGDPNTNTDQALPASGAVYMFASDARSWRHVAYVKATNPGEYDDFGFSVALDQAGATLVVGADLEDGPNAGVNPKDLDGLDDSGAAYVYSGL